jgi:hypothetical protein
MANFFKILPLLLKLGDVTDASKAAYPDGKPFWYTKRFWGSAVSLLFGVAAYYAVDLSLLGMTADQLTEKLVSIAESIGAVAGAGYGLIMAVKGVLDAKKRKSNPPLPSRDQGF